SLCVVLMIRLHPCAPRFPYTTLFRSSQPLLTASATESTGPSVTIWPSWKSLMAQQSEVTWPSKCHFPRRMSRSSVLLPQQGSPRSEEHTSELQSRFDLVCRLLLAITK